MSGTSPSGIKPSELSFCQEDPWLARQLGRPVFRVEVGPEPPEALRQELAQLAAWPAVFAFARVPAAWSRVSVFLQQQGFWLIEAAATLAREIEAGGAPDLQIRPARPEDEAAVRRLAHDNFLYSRFHQDPVFPPELAAALKAEWVGGYFRGQRGHCLLVAEQPGGIAGFLLLLEQPPGLIIDLVAVDRAWQGRQMATRLIGEAQRRYAGWATIQVGTQLANIPSIRLYEKLGFRLVRSDWVFHFHPPGSRL